MRILLDATGIADGGGVAVLRWFVLTLGGCAGVNECHVLVGRDLDVAGEFSHIPTVIFHSRRAGFLSRLWLYLVGIGGIKRRYKVDVVISIANLPPIFCGARKILFLHQSKILEREYRRTFRYCLMYLYLRAFLRSVERLYVQTDEMARLASSALGVCRRDVATLMTYNLGLANSSSEERASKDDVIRILYVSLPRDHKNHLRLIEAMQHLTDISFELQLTVSPGHPLHVFAESLGLAKGPSGGCIRFLGEVSNEEVHRLLQQSDLVVYPSLTESLGLPLIEALQHEKLIIAADRAYARDVLGNAAAYFDPLSPTDMANKIRSVVNSDELRNELRQRTAKRRLELIDCIDAQSTSFVDYVLR